jgi:hypothetical protein
MDGPSAARGSVVHERAGDELAVFGVIDRLLHQRLTDALHGAAMDLPREQKRIQRHAEIVDDDVVYHVITPVAGSISTSAMWVPSDRCRPRC